MKIPRLFTLPLVGLSLLATTAALRSQDLPIQNPGFEESEGWEQFKARQRFVPDGAIQAKEGTAVGFVGGWADGQGIQMSQVSKLTIKPGKTYVLSAWFAPRADGQSVYGGAWLRLLANKGSGEGQRPIVAFFENKETIEDWTRYELEWTAPDDLTQVPEVHGTKGTESGIMVDITGAKLEILVGMAPSLGNDPYNQTMIDQVELIEK